MLEHLRIYAARESLEEIRQHCRWFAELAGLRGDDEAVTPGAAEIEKLIIEGCRTLDANSMKEVVDRLGLRTGTARGTIVIQAIDRHPFPEAATVAIDWLDYFPATEPRERRHPVDPELWNNRFYPELVSAVEELRGQGLSDIRFDGAFRLSIGFAAGASAPRAAGLTVTFRGWSSSGLSAPFPVDVKTHDVGRGDELAVALCVTTHIDTDVMDYIEAAALPIGNVVEIAPKIWCGSDRDSGRARSSRFRRGCPRGDSPSRAWSFSDTSLPSRPKRDRGLARAPVESCTDDAAVRRCERPRGLPSDLLAQELAVALPDSPLRMRSTVTQR